MIARRIAPEIRRHVLPLPDDGRTYLYYLGNQCESTSGGWNRPIYYSASFNNPMIFEDSYMYQVPRTGEAAYLCSVNALDITAYTHLKCQLEHFRDFSLFIRTTSFESSGMYSSSALQAVAYHDHEMVKDAGIDPLTITLLDVDITGLTGSYFVGMFLYAYRSTDNKLLKIWLE